MAAYEIGRSYKPLIPGRGSHPHQVRSRSKELKGEETRNRVDGKNTFWIWVKNFLTYLKKNFKTDIFC